MTDLSRTIEDRPPKRNRPKAGPLKPRRASGEIVSASALGKHLGIARQYVSRLADDSVIERVAGGFNIDASRLRYLGWLRSPERRSVKSAADSELQKAKTRLIQLRVAEREGRLMEVVEMESLVDEMVGLFRTGLSGLAARVTRDLQIRRAIDAAAFDIMTEIANVAEERAAALEARKA